MTSMTLEISETRTITATGRLVAGETAQVTISGATPTAMYLVAPGQTVIAACEAFTPTGESGGVGYLQLATEQVAALFANTPAGRMIAVWALVNDADGVAGAGWAPVVSAPMPDELIDLDIDFYLRASQVGAGLAIVDGKLVCTVNPDTYLTKTEAAQTYAALADLATVARTGSYNDLKNKPTIPTVPVQSVNGQTGAVVLTGADIKASQDSTDTIFDVLVNLALNQRYAQGETLTASAQLADRTGNHVVPLADNTADIVLTFPDAVTGYLRDFLVLVTNTTGNTGSITFTPPTGAVVYGDGFTNSPASGETWLYSVTEEAANVFWCKSEKMEVAQ